MANAQDLISFAMAAVNRQPPLLYGQKVINGLSQRGPDSYDCIGFYRWCVLSIAPNRWPTSWGGEDSWTVPNYWGNIQGHFPIDNGPALAGDALIWIDNNGIQQHIAISDGKGNAISALNTIKNICIVQASSINLPIMKVVHNGLEQKMPVITPPGVPIGIARIGTDPAIKGLDAQLHYYALSLGSDIAVYAKAVQVGLNEPAYAVVDPASGKVINLLARNTTSFWSFTDSSAFWSFTDSSAVVITLQNKIAKAIAALS